MISLIPGSYRVEPAKTRVDSLLRKGVALTTGQPVVSELAMNVGSTSNNVTVLEATPLTETQAQSVGQRVNLRMVAGLPMPNREASSLVALATGVLMIDPGHGAGKHPVFSVAGGRGRNQ